ncbi:MAG: AbrB/MazE/SpoVT family DNA-binding domain-containing protein [Candidatus Bathyarchaeota archaeon]
MILLIYLFSESYGFEVEFFAVFFWVIDFSSVDYDGGLHVLDDVLGVFPNCWRVSNGGVEGLSITFLKLYLWLSMTEVSVTRKGQITIPVELRRKFGIDEGSKIEVVEEEGIIVIRKLGSIFDLAGNGAGKGDVEELKKMLDQMREDDA